MDAGKGFDETGARAIVIQEGARRREMRVVVDGGRRRVTDNDLQQDDNDKDEGEGADDGGVGCGRHCG